MAKKKGMTTAENVNKNITLPNKLLLAPLLDIILAGICWLTILLVVISE
jgi:hypothetical protein